MDDLIPFSAERAGEIVYFSMNKLAPASLDNLAAFAQAQYDYGVHIGVADPTLFAYEALGVALSQTSTAFLNQWGPLETFPLLGGGTVTTTPHYPLGTDQAFIEAAYATVFGREAGGLQVLHFVGQINYFKELYAASGAFGDAEHTDAAARGAVYGQMLGFEAEANLGFVGVPFQGPVPGLL